MDPLSALAIAAAVFQFLELGGKLCVKGWEKYKQIQQSVPDHQKLAAAEGELRKIFDELSDQISWFRQVSTSKAVSQSPTPTHLQLMALSDRCTELAGDFEQIENHMKLPTSREMKSEIHKNEHAGGRLRRQVQEKDCKECRKEMEREQHEFRKSKESVEAMMQKMDPLKREIIDFIILSLWDDSKRTKQWEWHFSSQLDQLIELLGSVEVTTTSNRLESTLSKQKTATQDQFYEVGHRKNYNQNSDAVTSTVADEETARLRNALQPFIQRGKGPVTLKRLAESMNACLQNNGEARNVIRVDLVQILWKNDWKLDTSIASAKIDTTTVAHAIATGVQFHNFQTRENAISNTFMDTYSWIFQSEPPKKDDKSMWDSFPNWLGDDSNKSYWITGKPGSGKSTMMKLILQHVDLGDMLSQQLGSLRLLLVKYYAWLGGTTLQKSLEGLKRTVISQTLVQFPDLAPVLVPRRWAFCQILRSTSGLPEWTAWEVEESFEALLSLCGETIKLALFIDGLDEFDTPPFEVIKCIQHMMARCPHGLKRVQCFKCIY
ncbi:uncharacterized protein Triagg1_4324 [Trichoderma aggressivum f. europaeum]|uniref:Nephrocystin 3-like N-terminal domain-containing protein n=1 Tax=Trichoderma aggressivum f. europaeum TaxID=173218 RepID=A0AAE1M662_9HYPO|nr:hypothetical protein Triagg1_4324 [Trichoderma aggressivum f. europaeum]